MYNTFISVVSLVHSDADVVQKFLKKITNALQTNFSSYEIILLNCGQDSIIGRLKEDIPTSFASMLKEVSVYNFSKQIEIHNAIVAGLDNAHGDYVILLDMELFQLPDIIEKLYLQSQMNFDIVYLKHKNVSGSIIRKLLLILFYKLIRRFADLDLDYKTHSNRIISRRALNRLLTIRSDWHFLLANLSEVGYPASYLEVNIPSKQGRTLRYDEIGLALSILISRTSLLNKLFIYLFVTSLIFSLAVITNALLVRFTGADIFGFPQAYVPGWAFIVVFLAITFNILLTILYFLYIYLTNIYSQVQRRPLYNIESIEKF